MDQFPESGRVEVEDGQRQIDRDMIVEQPPRHHSEQGFCDSQFSGRRRAVEQEKFHGLFDTAKWGPGARRETT